MNSFLSVDTSHGIFSINLHPESSSITHEESSRQAELLVPTIEHLLDKHQKRYADLDALSVCIGPGSFTGIRIGVGAVQGIALVSKLPIITVTCFEALAKKACDHYKKPALVILDAKREQLYVQGFAEDGITPLFSPMMIYYHEIDGILSMMPDSFMITGNGVSFVAKQLDDARICEPSFLRLPSIDDISHVVDYTLQHQLDSILSRPASPLYIRPPDAKKPCR